MNPDQDNREGSDRDGLKKLFEVWVDSDLKAQIVVFYHNNPGIIETVEGLARRLGISVEALRNGIADHVAMGLLKERVVGQKKVLVYDREKQEDIQRFISEKLADLERGGS